MATTQHRTKWPSPDEVDDEELLDEEDLEVRDPEAWKRDRERERQRKQERTATFDRPPRRR